MIRIRNAFVRHGSMPPVFGILSRCRSIIVSPGAASSRVIMFGASKCRDEAKKQGPRHMDHTISRREFLTTCGATAAVVTLDPAAFAAIGGILAEVPELGRPPHALGAADAGRG